MTTFRLLGQAGDATHWLPRFAELAQLVEQRFRKFEPAIFTPINRSDPDDTKSGLRGRNGKLHFIPGLPENAEIHTAGDNKGDNKTAFGLERTSWRMEGWRTNFLFGSRMRPAKPETMPTSGQFPKHLDKVSQ